MNIFDYSDYRNYLKEWLEKAKAEKTFNLSRLAEVAQVHPTFLSQVLSKGKDLSLEQAAFIARHIQLTKLEREYFFVLINLEKAGTKLLKEHWLVEKKDIEQEKNKLSERFDKHRELSAEQRAIYFSSWIYSAIWSASAIDGGQNISQIAERFSITRDKAEEVLSFLTMAGLCIEKGEVYSPGEMHVHVPNESPLVVKHHTNWRLKSIQKMDKREPKELFFTAPMAISQKDFTIIREKFNVIIKETINIAKDSASEELVCLSIDFFKFE